MWLYRLGLVVVLLVGLTEQRGPSEPIPSAPQISVEQRVFLPAVASTRPPAVTASYYIEGVTGLDVFRKLGCAAAYDEQQRALADGVVILFFGQPVYKPPIGADPGGYGTNPLGPVAYASIPQIRTAVQAWIDGYLNGYEDAFFRCNIPLSGLPRRTLVIATTNEPMVVDRPLVADVELPDVGDPDPTIREHGVAWGQLINNLGTYIAQKNSTRYLTIGGGNDIELAWNGPVDARAWVEGFHALSTFPLYVAAACDGCPDSPKNAPASGNYSYGWTAQDIWTVVTFDDTFVIPQIYLEDGTQARQWATLAVVTRSFGLIRYRSALTQLQACIDRQDKTSCAGVKNTPSQGWLQLNHALKTQGLDSRLPWLTDVRWDFDEVPFQKGGS